MAGDHSDHVQELSGRGVLDFEAATFDVRASMPDRELLPNRADHWLGSPVVVRLGAPYFDLRRHGAFCI